MTMKIIALTAGITATMFTATFSLASPGHSHDSDGEGEGMMMDGKMEMGGDMKDGKMDMHADAMTQGTLRKVDTEARTLTIKHGPIKNLGMPPMTMVFQTEDSVDLSELEVGDKVEFKVVDKSGKMTVTEIKAAN